MASSPNLALPYIEAGQAQKHVTHNEAVRGLDALVQLSVLDRDLTAPPGGPADGDRYIPASGATGAWANWDLNIAAYQDGAWVKLIPREGWLAWVADEDVLLVWDGSAWQSTGSNIVSLNPATGSLVGINATADATNRLAVSSPASLFNHEGNGHQVKVNKNAAGDTASFLFQTGFSARTEFGLTGDDDFHFKVSPDGSAFYEAFTLDRNSGEANFQQPVALKQYSVVSLPSAASGSARLIYVYDETGGPTVAYSDGGNWRRIYDNVVVS